MKRYDVGGYVRISKKTAKRLYDEGRVIYLCPNKLRPGFYWSPEIAVTKADLSECREGVQYFVSNTKDFETLVSEYAFYNCKGVAGDYPSYYIKK